MNYVKAGVHVAKAGLEKLGFDSEEDTIPRKFDDEAGFVKHLAAQMLERGELGLVEKDRLQKVVSGEIDLGGGIYTSEDFFDASGYNELRGLEPESDKFKGTGAVEEQIIANLKKQSGGTMSREKIMNLLLNQDAGPEEWQRDQFWNEDNLRRNFGSDDALFGGQSADTGLFIPTASYAKHFNQEDFQKAVSGVAVHEIAHKAMIPKEAESSILPEELFQGPDISMRGIPLAKGFNFAGTNEYYNSVAQGFGDDYSASPREIIARATQFHWWLKNNLSGDGGYSSDHKLSRSDFANLALKTEAETRWTGLDQWDFNNQDEFLRVANRAGLSGGFVPNFTKGFTPDKRMSYGGIVKNKDQEILLRKPTGMFGGYSWTFPKGGVDEGETPEQAALREVLEETGVKGRVTGEFPGEFEGDTSSLRLFMMEALEDGELTDEERSFFEKIQPIGEFGLAGPEGPWGWESEALDWFSPEKALEAVKETTSETGLKRDTAILDMIQKGIPEEIPNFNLQEGYPLLDGLEERARDKSLPLDERLKALQLFQKEWKEIKSKSVQSVKFSDIKSRGHVPNYNLQKGYPELGIPPLKAKGYVPNFNDPKTLAKWMNRDKMLLDLAIDRPSKAKGKEHELEISKGVKAGDFTPEQYFKHKIFKPHYEDKYGQEISQEAVKLWKAGEFSQGFIPNFVGGGFNPEAAAENDLVAIQSIEDIASDSNSDLRARQLASTLLRGESDTASIGMSEDEIQSIINNQKGAKKTGLKRVLKSLRSGEEALYRKMESGEIGTTQAFNTHPEITKLLARGRHSNQYGIVKDRIETRKEVDETGQLSIAEKPSGAILSFNPLEQARFKDPRLFTDEEGNKTPRGIRAVEFGIRPEVHADPRATAIDIILRNVTDAIEKSEKEFISTLNLDDSDKENIQENARLNREQRTAFPIADFNRLVGTIGQYVLQDSLIHHGSQKVQKADGSEETGFESKDIPIRSELVAGAEKVITNAPDFQEAIMKTGADIKIGGLDIKEAGPTFLEKKHRDMAQKELGTSPYDPNIVWHFDPERGTKYKKKSTGFIPNFASNATEAAIRAEHAAGIPMSNIRVSKHPLLKAPHNVDGYGVWNTGQEISVGQGMHFARQAGLDPKTKGMSNKSKWSVPNFEAKEEAGWLAKQYAQLGFGERREGLLTQAEEVIKALSLGSGNVADLKTATDKLSGSTANIFKDGDSSFIEKLELTPFGSEIHELLEAGSLLQSVSGESSFAALEDAKALQKEIDKLQKLQQV